MSEKKLTDVEKKEIVAGLLATIHRNIDTGDKDAVIKDFKFLISSLVEFVGNEEPRLLDSTRETHEMGKLFFKFIGGLAADGLMAGAMPHMKVKFEKKLAPVLQIFPLVQKYTSHE